ncbi:MAG: hypothetical protein V2I43_23750 [Parvularcula sp.]|jgi:hypothetical protein|nr:hypothetical protein [Parvularcula sp.]
MGKIIAAIVVVIVAFLGWTFLTDTDVEGGRAPDVDVDVSGDAGELPDVDVRGPDVTTGEREVTVPTIDIEPPEDDADGYEDEFADDEGLDDEPELEETYNEDEEMDPPNR